MKLCFCSICIAFVLLLSTSLQAETYSWVDDSGTYNFTEDFSRIPPKYQKKVQRRGDNQQQQEVRPQEVAAPQIISRPPEKTDSKTDGTMATDKGLYGGKSYADWRRELDSLEAELVGIEQNAEQLRKQIYELKGYPPARVDALKKEYDENRAQYDQKYKNYLGVVEAVRKAGVVVEFKK